MGIQFSSILCTCPNQRNPFNFIVSFIVDFLNNCIDFFISACQGASKISQKVPNYFQEALKID
jgi:hypothetical protein